MLLNVGDVIVSLAFAFGYKDPAGDIAADGRSLSAYDAFRAAARFVIEKVVEPEKDSGGWYFEARRLNNNDGIRDPRNELIWFSLGGATRTLITTDTIEIVGTYGKDGLILIFSS